MKSTAQEQKIARIIEPAIAEMGFELVQVRLIGSAKMQTLQIMAEDPATGKLDLNACAAISRAVSPLLDVEDPISSTYQLEISSPGIDRPLVKAADFTRFLDHDISVETETPNENGQKRFKGKLVSFDGNVATISDEQGMAAISIDSMAKAKLLLTDELIKSVLKKNSI